MKTIILSCGLLCAIAARGGVVVYPEYPPAIERDGEYEVSVTQGGKSHPLVVYNHCEKSICAGRTRGGDVNRRFCEFAFDGDPVRLDVRVSRDVSCYKVFPARHALKCVFKDGVISVWLAKPVYFGIQLNDYDKTILSVFADAPEKVDEIPNKNSPGIMYVEGWVDAGREDGVIETPKDVKEIYLAPGSVLNARLKINTEGLKMHGRGMVLDPLSNVFRYDQTKNQSRGVITVGAQGVKLDGFKFIDARTFNYISWMPRSELRNVKMLSSMMCTDGITFGGWGVTIENCWLYVGDNALVVSGNWGARIKDVAIGTSCNAIFPQGTNKGVWLENIDVFRSDESLIKNSYNAVLRRNTKWDELSAEKAKKEPGPQELAHQENEFFFKNLSAVDCTLFSHFFVGRNMGTKPKTFAFDGCSIPGSTGKDHYRTIGKKDGIAIDTHNNPKEWLITDNYSLSFTNLWIDAVRAEFPANAIDGKSSVKLSYAKNDLKRKVPLKPNRHEVQWTVPRRAKPIAEPGENIVAEEPAVRSIWQRAPSWLVKFDATRRDENGRIIYRLVQCEWWAGMQAVLTERFKVHGNGKWKFAFDIRARSELAFNLRLRLLSNEKEFIKYATILKTPSPKEFTAWKRVEADFDTAFDMSVTDLVALEIATPVPVDEIELRNLSFVRQNLGRAERK